MNKNNIIKLAAEEDINKLANVTAQLYEQEYKYWPWGLLVEFTKSWTIKNAPVGASIIDYMCGTGYLLNEIIKERPDLKIYGCSLTKHFIKYGQGKYKNIKIEEKNVFEYSPPEKVDIILCNGGLHHLYFDRQGDFINKVAEELSIDGVFIIGEEILRNFNSESERKAAVNEMYNHMTRYLLERSAPKDVLASLNNVWESDLRKINEYKLSDYLLTKLLEKHFIVSDREQIWPKETNEYGDKVYICLKRKS